MPQYVHTVVVPCWPDINTILLDHMAKMPIGEVRHSNKSAAYSLAIHDVPGYGMLTGASTLCRQPTVLQTLIKCHVYTCHMSKCQHVGNRTRGRSRANQNTNPVSYTLCPSEPHLTVTVYESIITFIHVIANPLATTTHRHPTARLTQQTWLP